MTPDVDGVRYGLSSSEALDYGGSQFGVWVPVASGLFLVVGAGLLIVFLVRILGGLFR